MAQSRSSRSRRHLETAARFTIAMGLLGSLTAEAQEGCVAAPLGGLPETLRAGQSVRLTVELNSGCNYEVVDAATLVCSFVDGRSFRQALDPPDDGPGRIEIAFVVPELETGGSGECHVEFSQCNEVHLTCAELASFQVPTLGGDLDPRPEPQVRPGRQPEGRRVPSAPPPRPPVGTRRPSPTPAPPTAPAARQASGDGGRFLRGLGWIGVAVGLGVYADAGSKEEEGRIEDAQKSEELAGQILAGSSVLLLMGYAIDANGYVTEREDVLQRRVQPSLSIDPFYGSVLLQVSVRLD